MHYFESFYFLPAMYQYVAPPAAGITVTLHLTLWIIGVAENKVWGLLDLSPDLMGMVYSALRASRA